MFPIDCTDIIGFEALVALNPKMAWSSTPMRSSPIEGRLSSTSRTRWEVDFGGHSYDPKRAKEPGKSDICIVYISSSFLFVFALLYLLWMAAITTWTVVLRIAEDRLDLDGTEYSEMRYESHVSRQSCLCGRVQAKGKVR